MNVLYHHRTRSTDAQRVHILEMIEALRSLGHSVDVAGIVPVDAHSEDAQRDADQVFWRKFVRRIPFSYEAVQLAYNPVGFAMLVWRMLRGDVDFIYERYALFTFAGILAARLFHKPIILEVNSPMALEQARDGDIRLRKLAQWSERIICNCATQVIVVTTPLGQMMRHIGVREEKLVVMSNGVRLEQFRPGSASKSLGCSLGLDGYIVAGFVGWFRDWHGLELLVEAAAKVKKLGCKMKLLLIGDGPARPGLRQLTTERDVADVMIFAGPQPHSKVHIYLDLIDIAVQPAANEYCCPMKLLEYMALGKAIVAPRQQNISELLRDGIEARLFSPRNSDDLAEALVALADDAGLRLSLGRNAREAISTRGYLWTDNARRVVEMAARNRRIGTVNVDQEVVSRSIK